MLSFYEFKRALGNALYVTRNGSLTYTILSGVPSSGPLLWAWSLLLVVFTGSSVATLLGIPLGFSPTVTILASFGVIGSYIPLALMWGVVRNKRRSLVNKLKRDNYTVNEKRRFFDKEYAFRRPTSRQMLAVSRLKVSVIDEDDVFRKMGVDPIEDEERF